MLTGQPYFSVPSTAIMLRAIAIAATLALLTWLLSDELLLLFAAVLIAVILRSMSDWLSRRTALPATLALAVVTLMLIALLCGLLYFMGPRLVKQGQQLWDHLHQQIGDLRQTYGDTPWGHLIFQQISPSAKLESRIASSTESVVSSTANDLITAFVVGVTAIYLAINPELYASGVVQLFPLSYRRRAREVLRHIRTTLVWWVLGQCIDMTVVAVMSAIGLMLLGVPLALALALLSGLLTFIPYFGAIAAAVPAVMVSLATGWHLAPWVVLVFLCCHAAEGYIVAPMVQRRTVHLPPALTIFSMMILGGIAGPLGLILGTPVAATFLVAVREVYVSDVLGDRETRDGQPTDAPVADCKSPIPVAEGQLH
jgi:predicted PurR-regulated permease PerM